MGSLDFGNVCRQHLVSVGSFRVEAVALAGSRPPGSARPLFSLGLAAGRDGNIKRNFVKIVLCFDEIMRSLTRLRFSFFSISYAITRTTHNKNQQTEDANKTPHKTIKQKP